MKKIFFFTLIALSIFHVQADEIIPNASFENWSASSYVSPENYPYTSNLQASYEESPTNLTKTTDAYHGTYAVKLSTLSSNDGTTFAYFLNTDPDEGDLNQWKNGFLYNEIPTGIRGYYKYNVETADSALIMVVFRKSGSSIGNYIFKIGGIKNTYTLFDFNFSPVLTQTPDSVILGAVSSDFMKHENGLPGSVLFIDSISFKGVTSQPILMNGDFENWSTYNLPSVLDNWNPKDKYKQGVAKTNDAKQGSFAVELTSYLGKEKNENDEEVQRTEPGYLTTGHWSNVCNCVTGGIPFTNILDTLSFWYKYTPTSNDYAEVSLNFRKNGSQYDGRVLQLSASSVYKYVEMPFQLNTQPDSLVLSFISSPWSHKDLSFIGSKLVLDDIKFKSQIIYTGLSEISNSDPVRIQALNSRGKYIVNYEGNASIKVSVYNTAGIKILNVSGITPTFELTNKPKGVYFVQIEFLNKIYSQKLIVN